MPSKITREISLAKITDSGAYKYPWIEKTDEVGTFTSSMNTCYVGDLILKRIKGGGKFGGNYKCEATGNEYRITT